MIIFVLLSGCAYMDGKTDPGFDIQIEYSGWSPTSSERAAIQSAVARWERIITEDIPDQDAWLTQEAIDNSPTDVPCDAIEAVVDDLLIFVQIDSTLPALAASQQCLIRESQPYLPYLGGITLSEQLLEGGASEDSLDETAAHEIGHILGLRSIAWNLDIDADGTWERLYVPGMEPVCPDDEQVFYEGPLAIDAWQDLGGTGSIPMEAGGDDGSRCEHWDSTVFGNELMTAWRGEGDSPLSLVTIRAIEELGYAVDASQADDFELVGLELDSGEP